MDDLKSYLATCNDTVYESVPVPEWGNRTVWVRSLTNEEKSAYEESCLTTKRKIVNGKAKESKETNILVVRAKLVVLATCKGEGDPAPVLAPSDYKLILKRNASAVERIFDVAAKLSRLTKEDVEELAGNSEDNQKDVSG